jgi:zinc transport system permease protein
MFDALSMTFFQNAVLAGVLASVACGVIGSLVVVNRQVFLAGGVAHAAYGGVGLAFFFGLPVLPTAVAFTALAALLTAHFTFGRRERTDSFVGVLWASGMALGIILIDLAPGYNVDLMSYLFGSILTVSRGDVAAMLLLDAIILLAVWRWYGELLSLSFDMEYARASGIPVKRLYGLMLIMVAVAVVLVIQVVGLILVIALLTIPPMLAETGSRSLSRMMLGASLWCLVFCMLGLGLAWQFDLASGAAIIAVAAASFFIIRIGRIGKSLLQRSA